MMNNTLFKNVLWMIAFFACTQNAMMRTPVKLTTPQHCMLRELKVRDLKDNLMRDLNKEALKLGITRKHQLLRKWNIEGSNAANILKNARIEMSVNIEKSQDNEFDLQKADDDFNNAFTYQLPNYWPSFHLVYKEISPILEEKGIKQDQIFKWMGGDTIGEACHETHKTAVGLYSLLKNYDHFAKRAVELEAFQDADSADMLLLLAWENISAQRFSYFCDMKLLFRIQTEIAPFISWASLHPKWVKPLPEK